MGGRKGCKPSLTVYKRLGGGSEKGAGSTKTYGHLTVLYRSSSNGAHHIVSAAAGDQNSFSQSQLIPHFLSHASKDEGARLHWRKLIE